MRQVAGRPAPGSGRRDGVFGRRVSAVVAVLALALLIAPGGGRAAPVAAAQDSARAASCPCSIWDDSATPEIPSVSDPLAVELGVRFQSSLDGYITGIRFFKGVENTGVHVGHLWSDAGKLLGAALFTDESVTGWQLAALGAPVPIKANTTYVASYHAPTGNYAATRGLFDQAGVEHAPLRALPSGPDGGNGVFKYGATGGFPNETYMSTNYWVDVVFATSATDTVAPAVVSQLPADGATGVALAGRVSATFAEDVSATSIVIELKAGATPVPGRVTYDGESRTATWTADGPLAASTTYSVTVSGATDQAGNQMTAPVSWSFTTVAATPPPSGPSAPAPPARPELTVAVSIDRGAGATYMMGEDLTVCVAVSRVAFVRLTANLASFEGGVVFDGRIIEGRRCFSVHLVAQISGGKSFRAEVSDIDGVTAVGEVGFDLQDLP